MGAGGLVAVLGPALERLGGTWLFAPASMEDRELARAGTPLEYGSATLRIVDLPQEAHHDHYATISSELLSRLFHYLFELPRRPTFDDRFKTAWENYCLINQIFGGAIRAHVDDHRGGVLIDDMHLMLAAAFVRAGPGVEAPLSYFHHVPWCEPEHFGVLPAPVREEILAGMLSHDAVGFHCTRWADSFVACCERFLPGAARAGDRVEWEGRSTALLVAPATVDVEVIKERAGSQRATEWRSQLAELTGPRRVIARVERADPSKNALRGIEAYKLLLEREPHLARDVCLLVVLTPVRGWIAQYAEYLDNCVGAATGVNQRFGTSHEPAVQLHVEPDSDGSDHHRALAALALADVVFVNPTIDGLNLVAMEAPLVGDSALVLSENTGAYDLLGEYAFGVHPFDVSMTRDQLGAALSQPEDQRCGSAEVLRQIVAQRRPEDWVTLRLEAST